MITLYDTPRSGHCYRVRLLLGFLGLEVRSVPVLGAARQEPWYLAINPLGQVPVLDDDGFVLPDSNAILVYLARRYDPSETWLPLDPRALSRVQRWLSIAAGELVQGVVKLRGAAVYGRAIDRPAAQAIAERLLAMMEAHTAEHRFLAAEHPTIADPSLFSYLTLADEAGLDLGPFPALRAWLGRVEALPGFVPIPRT